MYKILIKIIFLVVGTAKEPIGGWIDNVYGPTGVNVNYFILTIRIKC